MTTKAISDKPLTRRQQEIYDFIADFIDQHRYGPTIREIADAFMITSASTVHGVLDRLIIKGCLTRTPNGPRTLALTDKSCKKIAMVSREGVMDWIERQSNQHAKDALVYALLTDLQEGIQTGRIC
ncbi:hypothetical protein Q0V21_25210 [Paenibacillus sp. 11B]|uniref:LexA family protein n=1 Tax=unclassified Paenibacillus TaxID=185978 RepID=UPI00264AC1C6|nr:hypothetical protein [Paenibacillus sp. 11B]MDN8592050.1 hypothetical protein [Paenibacillus sp. 11B]